MEHSDVAEENGFTEEEEADSADEQETAAPEFETGTIDWFLEQCDNTPEEKELKRQAWELMEEGAYDQALRILWKHFPEEYPIPEKELERYKDRI